MIATATVHETANGTHVGSYTFEAPCWRDCVYGILYWLRIEVLPYWPIDALRLSWFNDTDRDIAAALYGIGLSHSLVDQQAVRAAHEQVFAEAGSDASQR